MAGHPARVVNPLALNGPTIPSRPRWYTEWLQNQGKWVRLSCGCIQDVHLPSCVELLTGKKILIQCDANDEHGFQSIKKTLKFKDVIEEKLGIILPKQGNIPLF